jgi:predicted DNA repair protein MutK
MPSSLFALLDDIATGLDDVALLTKVAARKTAGVLGDDLALNAQQVAGISADRELPVVLAVARGSAINKAILVPAALAISALAPWAVTPLLMIGGAFLCYEGVEKIAHKLFHGKADDAAHEGELMHALADPTADLVAIEKDKIKGAVRTDFILSAEIIVITLGTVADSTFLNQVTVLTGIAVIMTVGVYGLVASIVKLDDVGLYLSRRSGQMALARMQRGLGDVILLGAPWLMKGLSVVGTAAMFLVGGGILVHGIPALHHSVERFADLLAELPTVGHTLRLLTITAVDATTGIIAGALVLGIMAGVRRVLRPRAELSASPESLASFAGESDRRH